jgi:hypothetical protein
MMYGDILQAYLRGERVGDIARGLGLKVDLVLGVLEDAGGACAKCGILLRHVDTCGIAEVGGLRMCQDCVEFLRLDPDRWIVEPVEIIRDEIELQGFSLRTEAA